VRLRITLEGRSYEVEVEVLPDAASVPAETEEPRVPETVLSPPPPADIRPEDRICRSPIAGVVVYVVAALDQPIRQNDPVVVIEAMKMQTAIGAPVDGTVRELHVSPGETVKPGQPLCTLA
jgi:biotin carboxyl carrier protein